MYQSGTGPNDALDGFYNDQPSVMSMHIVDTDLYFVFIFHQWTSNANGGGFSYTRFQVEDIDNFFLDSLCRFY